MQLIYNSLREERNLSMDGRRIEKSGNSRLATVMTATVALRRPLSAGHWLYTIRGSPVAHWR